MDLSEMLIWDGVLFGRTPTRARTGEGGAVKLNDGRILLTFSAFGAGRADTDMSNIHGIFYDPSENKWSEPFSIVECPPDYANVMSVSLLRLPSGELAFLYVERIEPFKDRVLILFSLDEGMSWSSPVTIVPESDEYYWVVNNDRLVITSSNRLLLPVWEGKPESEWPWKHTACRIWYSDDLGRSWQKTEAMTIKPENIITPMSTSTEAFVAWRKERGYVANEEPGIVELANGSLLLWCRTNLGYMYTAYSYDNGKNWTPFKPQTDIVSPRSPQAIKRVPDSNRLICVYNDRQKLLEDNTIDSWPPEKFEERTPLTLAVSDDNGETWRNIAELENDQYNYCYTSILFYNDCLMLSFYQSANYIIHGEPKRDNLASLKVKVLKTDFIQNS